MEKLRLVLDEWFRSPIPTLKERGVLSVDLPEELGIVLSGVRRCGKTYTLFELAGRLRSLLPPNNIVYLNLEDERLLPIEGKEIQVLISVLRENFKIDRKYPLWILLDEVQSIPQWWNYVKGIIDRREARIVVTGSSASLTGKEISSKLAGRVLIKSLYPLSFWEFLQFKGFSLGSGSYKYSLRPDILYHFHQFLEFGGFPKVVLLEREEEKRELLSNYFLTIFYRDIVERFSIRKVAEFENFVRLTLKQAGALLSVSRMVNFMNSMGFKISRPTIIEYLRFAQEALLIYLVEIFSYKLKDRLQYPRKVYCVDTGLVNLSRFKLKTDWGSLLENAVFIELLRRGKDVFYWKDERGAEVDFVELKNMEPVSLIQVCWNPTRETMSREVKALLKGMEYFHIKEGIVITRDFSRLERVNKKRIVFKPFWEWALEKND